MNIRFAVLTLSVAVFVAGCASGNGNGRGEDEDTWIGTITTEGAVTTVVTEAGSVWGRRATLVEEASIGVESGADEYMFGNISYTVYAAGNRIYVVDSQVPIVRVYDLDGNFVHNLGEEGQGPGEYVFPTILAANQQGRAFVLDPRLSRINVYDSTGESDDTWMLQDARCCAWRMYPLGGYSIWAPVRDGLTRFGAQAVGVDGPYGDVSWVPEIAYEQSTYEATGGLKAVAPFGAWLLWNPAPNGKLIFGATDRYRFEVHSRDGTKLIVERHWEEVPVPAEHKDWERRRAIAFERRRNRGFTWDGEEIPDYKPAYQSLIPSLSGEVWVVRLGVSRRLSGCAEDPIAEGHPAGFERPCWTDERIVDVFGEDGRYLGEIDVPDDVQGGPHSIFVDGDRVVAVVQDENGVYMVKSYRLALEGEE